MSISGIAVITSVGGNGGVGVVSFRHGRAGPDGGDGGDGGNVVVVATEKLRGSMAVLHGKKMVARDGGSGAGETSTGKRGRDVRVAVPVGTIVWEELEDGRRRLGPRASIAAFVAWSGAK